MSFDSHWLDSSRCNAFYVWPNHCRQSELAIFQAQFARDTTKCAFGTRDKCRRFLRAVGSLIPFHIPINCRTESTSSVCEQSHLHYKSASTSLRAAEILSRKWFCQRRCSRL